MISARLTGRNSIGRGGEIDRARFGHLVGDPAAEIVLAGQGFGPRHGGASIWCSRPGFVDLKRNGHMKDLAAVLDGDHAARTETLAVPAAVDFVQDREPWDRRATENRRAANGRTGPRRCAWAATSACPSTCPPNTRWERSFGLMPRKILTSIGSRSSSATSSLDGRQRVNCPGSRHASPIVEPVGRFASSGGFASAAYPAINTA